MEFPGGIRLSPPSPSLAHIPPICFHLLDLKNRQCTFRSLWDRSLVIPATAVSELVASIILIPNSLISPASHLFLHLPRARVPATFSSEHRHFHASKNAMPGPDRPPVLCTSSAAIASSNHLIFCRRAADSQSQCGMSLLSRHSKRGPVALERGERSCSYHSPCLSLDAEKSLQFFLLEEPFLHSVAPWASGGNV